MVLLTQRKQLGLKVEAVEGTAETITASELVTVLNPAATINLNNVRRPVLRGSFSKVTSGTGIQDAVVTYDQEFAGPADAAVTTASPLGQSLRATGWRQFDLYAVEIATFTGTGVVVGDLLVSNTTASTIRVAASLTVDAFDDATVHSDILFFEEVSGPGIDATDTSLAAANPNLTVTTVSHGGGTPAIGLSSQVATRAGTGWLPTSQQTKTITISGTSGTFTSGETVYQAIDNASLPSALDVAYGRVVEATATTLEYVPYLGNGFDMVNAGAGDVTGVSSGATAQVDSDASGTQTPSITAKVFEDGIAKTFAGGRGSSTMTLPTGEFPLLNVSLNAAYDSVADLANLDAGGAAQATVPTFLGIEYRVGRVWQPCTATITVDMGQNVVRRTCATPASGLEGFAITDRTPTLTMDPEAIQEIVFAAYGNAKAATPFAAQLRFGVYSTGAGVDAWLMSFDQLQYEALNSGDRDGIVTHDSTLQVNSFTTLNDSEMSILNYSRTVVEAL